ncbi:MAG TPA: pyridoxal phosphate-dependent aminotransferase [Pyrinomonadaceae bacterium]|nr:pyridoxal phosphate-dependent aminotransferase [Pyrinomonadaceae bacterium]
MNQTKQSDYMHWAKTRSRARFNLATSGLANLTLKDLDVSLNELEITGDSGYGYEPLIRALADRYQVETESIVTAAGTSFANHLAMAGLVNPGDEVVIERPVYEPLLALAHYLGANVKRFERRFEDGFRILPAEIEKSVTTNTRLIVITNFHNPSGVVTDEETLKEIGEIARRVNARVLVDEVYLEMLFRNMPPTSFHLGKEFVITSSLTKAFGLSGLRCGWIFAEPEIAERLWRLNDLFAASPVHAGERLSVVALKQLAGLAEKSRSRLDHHRQLLNEFLDSRSDLESIRPSSGSIMFPRMRQGSAEELFTLLREKYETSVVPGRFFESPSHFRIGLGGDTESLTEGLRRLGAALDEAAGVPPASLVILF